MERPYPEFPLDIVQFHAGCCTVDWSFISMPFIGAVGLWWETDSHSDKVASLNYFGFPLHIKNSSRTCEQCEINFLFALSRSSFSSPIKQRSECIWRHTQHLLPISLCELQKSQQLIIANFIIWKQLRSSSSSFESQLSRESVKKKKK